MLGLKLNHVSKRGHRWSGTSGRRWAYSAHPSSQIQWERGRTDSCKFSFTDHTISEWSKLSAELAESGSLDIFRSRLAANLVCRPTGALWVNLTVHIRCFQLSNNPSLQLTHWGRNKMDAISQTTFSNAFSLMKIFEFWLKFHWCLFLRVQLTIFQLWFR